MILNHIKDPKILYEKFKSIKEGFKSSNYLMTDDNGNLVSDPKMIIDKFKTYSENLLSNKSDNEIDRIKEPAENQIYVTVESEVPEPSLEEIKSIESQKNNKALGKCTQNHLNLIWKQDKLEKGWNTAIICSIYNKGDPKKVENQRSISFLDTASKVLSIAILLRLEKYSIKIIGEYQCCFMKGKSNTDHIFEYSLSDRY